MKLNLGCGAKYLKGYINVDAPKGPKSDSLIKADIYSKIEDLDYLEGSIEGIKMEAVFEHFPRHTALFLLRKFYKWLQKDGWISIIVPDFLKTVDVIKNLPDVDKQLFYFRHLFGPQDVIEYGTHFDGFTVPKLEKTFEAVGFNDFKSKRKGRWPSIYFTAYRKEPFIGDEEAKYRIENLLRKYTRGKKANYLLKTWMKDL